jgi:hypothetical protein
VVDMNTRKQIFQILIKNYYSLACDTCEHNHDGDKPCNPCTRFPERWISAIDLCDHVADEIMEIFYAR